jgi:hypothetical protein
MFFLFSDALRPDRLVEPFAVVFFEFLGAILCHELDATGASKLQSQTSEIAEA